MTRRTTTKKGRVAPKPIGPCRECRHHYDDHELTAYEPHMPFLTRCPFPDKYDKYPSHFLNRPCDNGHFEPIR